MSELLREQLLTGKTKLDTDSFNVYQSLRDYVACNGKLFTASELTNFMNGFPIAGNLRVGIIREIRALYYLSEGQPKGNFEMTNVIEDLMGIDINGFAPDKEDIVKLHKFKFQVGGVTPDKKALSGKVDYYVQVTDNKIYVHHLV